MTERMTKEGLWSEIQKNSPAATEPTDAIALSELEPVQESVEPTDATTSPDLEPEQPPTEPTSVDVIVPSELEPVQEPVESTPIDATAPSELEPMQEPTEATPTESIEAAIVELPQSEVIPAQEIIGDAEQVGESQELPTPVELPAKKAVSSVVAPRKRNGFDRYSLTGLSSELEKDVSTAVPVLGEMVLSGECSVLYAPPNTGKTLILLNLLMEAAIKKCFNISSLYYFNMDDSGIGMIEKLRIAEEFGFQGLADGRLGFKATDFNRIIHDMIDSNQCKGIIVILDTLKRFVDLMDKKKASQFTTMIRQFTSLGGTFIGLAHANKNLSSSGDVVYSGTSDIVDDIDCAYTLKRIREEDGYVYVQFKNIKRRSNVPLYSTYRYTNDSAASYNEKVLSVECVNPNEDVSFQEATQQKAETVVIEALKAAIHKGFDSKMALANSYVAKEVGLSRAKMLKIIEKYTGDDISQHHWGVTVIGNNKHIFTVLVA